MTDTPDFLTITDTDLYYWVNSNLHHTKDWTELLTPNMIDRTMVATYRVRDSIETEVDFRRQMGSLEGDWHRSAARKIASANTRLRQIDRVLTPAVPGYSATKDSQGWKKFADEIVNMVLDYAPDEVVDRLENIKIPSGDLDAISWVERRAEKRGLE